MDLSTPDRPVRHPTASQTASTTSFRFVDETETFTPAVTPTPIVSRFQASRSIKPRNSGRTTYKWFTVPPEIRNTIYKYLIGDVTIVVDGSANSKMRIRRLGSNSIGPFNPALIQGTNTNAWLVVSRRFFQEARSILWEVVNFKFQRRWDVINAFANQSLNVEPASTAPRGLDNISMSPIASNVF